MLPQTQTRQPAQPVSLLSEANHFIHQKYNQKVPEKQKEEPLALGNEETCFRTLVAASFHILEGQKQRTHPSVSRNREARRASTQRGSAAVAAKSLQSCPTLRNPIDGSPPGSAVPGILQARTLEWVAISFSNA